MPQIKKIANQFEFSQKALFPIMQYVVVIHCPVNKKLKAQNILDIRYSVVRQQCKKILLEKPFKICLKREGSASVSELFNE